jgi:toxin ParE1/3/4
MAKFHLTQRAVDDLDGIWNYTCSTWSEKIADEYYRGVVRELRQITNQEYMNLDKKYNEIQSGLYGHRFKHHIIFYDFLTDGDVRIIRILHEMMDFKSRLS